MGTLSSQPLVLENANAMPAPTWHFLKMNDVDIELPSELVAKPLVKTRIVGDVAGAALFAAIDGTDTADSDESIASDDGGIDGSQNNFADGSIDDSTSGATDASFVKDALGEAIQQLRAKWEATHPEPTEEERTERAAILAAEADATYGGTAQSQYQASADALEESRALSISPDGGMGPAVDAFLAAAPHKHVVVACGPRGTADAQVIVNSGAGVASFAVIDVVAAKDSAIKLSLVVDSDEDESEDAVGVAGTFVRVFAGENSTVSVVRTQTLNGRFVDLDDMALVLDERARVEVRQTVLGADTAYAGMVGDLRGDLSLVNVDTRYLGHGEQSRDFNYTLRHHGARTRCNLNANGVLAGKSQKTLRGTIDLIRGCKGAEGSENETVLLVDEGVRNKTVPVILCNEDDVAGNHGATIGHIREEQLFYLASRGLSQEAAETMFVDAALEQAAIDAPDDFAQAGVLRLGEQIAPGFAERFQE